MKKNKILIISISAGTGHIMAGNALEKTAKESFKNLDVKHIDIADFMPKPIKALSVNSYELMAKKMPELWGLLYDKTDNTKASTLLNNILKLSKYFSVNQFLSEIKKINPDYIICTHFLPAYFINHSPKKTKPECPLAMVITDYELHSLWLSKNISHYFVATDKMKKSIEKKYIKNIKITVSGIPLRPEFYKKKSVIALKKKHKLQKDNFTILVLAGGHGLIKTDKIVKLLSKTSLDLNIIAVAGKNLKLKNNLKKIKTTKGKEIKVMGWVNKIDELIRISDIVITKPGGISVSECIALNKPIFAVRPIPGQEEKNVQFIQKNKLGKLIGTPEDLLQYIRAFKTGKLKFSKLKVQNSSKIILGEIKKEMNR
ncbi:MAG: hypothetical protein L3J07_03925 [Candidatus Magasanikbacteria bacterium]|nr:hypothetical protein [Candidatus Magasanikbacteria bacterium]